MLQSFKSLFNKSNQKPKPQTTTALVPKFSALESCKPSTLVLHVDSDFSEDVAPPIHVSTIFSRGEFIYSRADQPTRARVEEVIGHIENGTTITYSSGSAALFSLLECTRPNKIILVHVEDPKTKTILNAFSKIVEPPIEITTVTTNLQKNDLILIESPSSLRCNLTDIQKYAKMAATCGAFIVVDSTYGTPYLQTPIKQGADYVYHSTLKYLSGDATLSGGVLICRDRGRAYWLQTFRTTNGHVMGTFECFLLLRGFRSFFVRAEIQSKNTVKVVTWLAGCTGVKAVYHPCLNRDVDSATWPFFFGFEMEREKDARDLVGNLKVFKLVGELEDELDGCVMSTIELRCGLDVPSGLLLCIRVGLESYKDLVKDLSVGLASLVE